VARFFLREQFLIERGEDFHCAIIGDGDVARIVGAPISESDSGRYGRARRCRYHQHPSWRQDDRQFSWKCHRRNKNRSWSRLDRPLTDIDATVSAAHCGSWIIAVEFVGEEWELVPSRFMR